MFLQILHLFAVSLHTCTAVARSLCVSWAFLFLQIMRGLSGRLKIPPARTGSLCDYRVSVQWIRTRVVVVRVMSTLDALLQSDTVPPWSTHVVWADLLRPSLRKYAHGLCVIRRRIIRERRWPAFTKSLAQTLRSNRTTLHAIYHGQVTKSWPMQRYISTNNKKLSYRLENRASVWCIRLIMMLLSGICFLTRDSCTGR